MSDDTTQFVPISSVRLSLLKVMSWRKADDVLRGIEDKAVTILGNDVMKFNMFFNIYAKEERKKLEEIRTAVKDLPDTGGLKEVFLDHLTSVEDALRSLESEISNPSAAYTSSEQEKVDVKQNIELSIDEVLNVLNLMGLLTYPARSLADLKAGDRSYIQQRLVRR